MSQHEKDTVKKRKKKFGNEMREKIGMEEIQWNYSNVYYLTVYIDIIEYTQIHRNLYQQLVDRFDFIISSFHFG